MATGSRRHPAQKSILGVHETFPAEQERLDSGQANQEHFITPEHGMSTEQRIEMTPLVEYDIQPFEDNDMSHGQVQPQRDSSRDIQSIDPNVKLRQKPLYMRWI